jgi:hypothetical protein
LWSLFAAPLLSQDPRGSIVGQVADTGGAVIPGVGVKVVSSETNVGITAISNAAGAYEALYLNPGLYQVSVEHSGFNKWTRSGIEIRTLDRLRIDIQLQVGDVTEQIEVTAVAPLIESTTATVSGVISSQELSALPLPGGNLLTAFAMAPHASLWRREGADGPWNPDSSQRIGLGGSGRGQVDFSLDGVSNNSYDGKVSITPPPDMVQELRIDVATYDAALGHSSAGSINVTLKAGTNALHGAAGFFGSWTPLQARNFFTNKFIFDPATGPVTPEKIKANTPETTWLRGTVSAGGPVYIPNIYNGRNKTFFMYGFQNHNQQNPGQTQQTVPTEAQRAGNFSGLLALGSQYQIYDPMTTVPSGAARFKRDPLPGNLIPASRIDSVARSQLRHFPLPTDAGTTDGLNNFKAPGSNSRILYQHIVRIDHNVSQNHRLFARYSNSQFTADLGFIPGVDVVGRTRKRPHHGVALDNVFVLSPQVVFDVRYGLSWFREDETRPHAGWDLTEFGFPESLLRQLDPQGIAYPSIQISKYMALGDAGGWLRTNYSHSLLSVLSWSTGAHSLKFGADFRLPFETYHDYGNVAPRLDFAETYTRGPLDNSPAAPVGQGLASFLLGIPTGGWSDINDSRAESNRFYSAFVQDDWRVSRQLTVNLGLRWEYDNPLTERFNRTTRDFDFVTVNPIQTAASAKYATAPIPEIPVNQFRTLGGVTFAGAGGNPRGIRDAYYRAFMPRIGFAFQARPKVVLRGGYGIYFGLLGAELADVSQPGFNQQTSIVPSRDNGVTYAASISNPLPEGLVQPLGGSAGLLTFLGRSPGFFASDGRRPYTQKWSFSSQTEPVRNLLFEITYMGSRTTRARLSQQFNAVPEQYLSTSRERDQAVIDNLTARAANPFVGIAGFGGSSLFTAANTTKSQLLRPFPHFGDLSTGLPAGSAWYHGVSFRAERRLSQGLQIQAMYTWSRAMEAVSYLNPTDRIPEHLVADMDRPHRVVISGMYELPFGANKTFLSSGGRFLNTLVEGWQVQAIFTWQSGAANEWGNVIFRGNEWADINLESGQRTLGRWFNTDVFERSAARQLQSNIRYFPSRLSAVRTDPTNVWDISVNKTFQVREGVKLQARAEAQAALNHPTFGRIPQGVGGNFTNPTSSLFGVITNTAFGVERIIFLGAKLIF